MVCACIVAVAAAVAVAVVVVLPVAVGVAVAVAVAVAAAPSPSGRFIFNRVSENGFLPRNFDNSFQAHYMRAQGRMAAGMQLQMLARGQDVRGDNDPNSEDEFEVSHVSVSKLHGFMVPENVIGPDRMYLLKLLKDNCAKHNQLGRPELIACCRNPDPLKCVLNATATVAILRFGRHGIVGKLPDLFNFDENWPEKHNLLTTKDGKRPMPYRGTVATGMGHVQLFEEMKIGAGLLGVLKDILTKLRSYAAMNAVLYNADFNEVERSGRWNSGRGATAANSHTMSKHYLRIPSLQVCLAGVGLDAHERRMYVIPHQRAGLLLPKYQVVAV